MQYILTLLKRLIRLTIQLRGFGFSGNMLKLIQSYMQDRTQVVNIKGSESKAVVATSRVPQDSIWDQYYSHCLSMISS